MPDADALTAFDLAAVLDDPVIVVGRDAFVVFMNEAARQAFANLGEGASLFMRFRTLEIRDLVEAASRNGARAAAEYVERVPLERVFRVVASHLGGPRGLVVLTFKDQSEARRIDRMRADFIANASHELRTPLASIAGFIETLRGPARDDARARENFLGIMQAQTRRMARLIDDLLSLSRREMKPRIDPRARVDLAALLDAVSAALAPLAADNGLEIARLYGDGPAFVAADRDELTQVLENLVENACKYGASGDRIELTLERGAGELCVGVRDFGEGIPEQHIPRVTERFYRIDGDAARPQKGTGLGLAIVKHIVTRHGGRLAIASTVGEGSTFTVCLPAAPA